MCSKKISSFQLLRFLFGSNWDIGILMFFALFEQLYMVFADWPGITSRFVLLFIKLIYSLFYDLKIAASTLIKHDAIASQASIIKVSRSCNYPVTPPNPFRKNMFLTLSRHLRASFKYSLAIGIAMFYHLYNSFSVSRFLCSDMEKKLVRKKNKKVK